MKQFWLNCICLTFLLLSGLLMFGVKHYTVVKGQNLENLEEEITQLNRDIHTLKAEWAYLTNPERLRQLIKNQTTLKPITAEQIKEINEINQEAENE